MKVEFGLLFYLLAGIEAIHTYVRCQFKAPKHQISLTSSRAILFYVKPLKKYLQLGKQGVQTQKCSEKGR